MKTIVRTVIQGIFLSSALSCVLARSVAAQPRPPEGCTIEGNVTGAVNEVRHIAAGELKTKRVTIGSLGKGGAYRLEKLPAGTYDVHAVSKTTRPLNATPRSQKVACGGNRTMRVDFRIGDATVDLDSLASKGRQLRDAIMGYGMANSWGFESGNLEGWEVSGRAFEYQPLRGAQILAQQIRTGSSPPATLGGDYWQVPYPIGHAGTFWVGSGFRGDDRTGSLQSSEITLSHDFISFLIGGTMDRARLKVVLELKQGVRWDVAQEATGNNSELLRREVWSVRTLKGNTVRLRIVDDSPAGHINVDDFQFTNENPRAGLVATTENGIRVFRDPRAAVWGVADMHAHLMSHLAFGGNAFWGQMFVNAGGTFVDRLRTALAWCTPAHGPGGAWLNPKIGHLVGGYPEFDGWPRFSSIVHQQAYVDWVRRAYQGGVRLISLLAVNNELLAETFSPRLSTDDPSTIDRQIQAAWDLVAFLDEQAGGPGRGWAQIALSPADARRIIQENKLAIVLGIEVDSLGGWRTPESLAAATRSGTLEEARELIRGELSRLHRMGVRQITPVHLSDNAFGGAAIYGRYFDANNLFLTGHQYEVEEGWDVGVRYRLDQDQGEDGLKGMIARALSYRDLGAAFHAPTPAEWTRYRSHINRRGLTSYGEILLDEMARLGMIIDLDHFSNKATNQALAMMEAKNYPVVLSHAGIREAMFTASVPFSESTYRSYGTSDITKLPDEGEKTVEQITRVKRLGGVVGLITNQRDTPLGSARLPNDAPGSSKTWAQFYVFALSILGGDGVALGTDINGMAEEPGPRFGPYAANAIAEDSIREVSRRRQVDAQRNGVRYDSPVRDYRRHRFFFDDGIYNEEEKDIWVAIALAKSGQNINRADLSLPTLETRHVIDGPWSENWIRNIAAGLRASSLDSIPEPTLGDDLFHFDRARVRRGAFHAKVGTDPAAIADDEIREVREKVGRILSRWEAMEGSNLPLSRSFAGNRDFDINLDGFAHHGMIPDFLQDLKNVGLTRDELTPLFRSAENYIRMWEQCEGRGSVLTTDSSRD